LSLILIFDVASKKRYHFFTFLFDSIWLGTDHQSLFLKEFYP
jgi:hypothetical protein